MRTRSGVAVPVLLAGLLLAGCTNSPVTGRNQVVLVDSQALNQQAARQYAAELQPYRQRGLVDQDAAQAARIRAITNRLVAQAVAIAPATRNWAWEVHLITDRNPNAYALPGGKMAINTGLVSGLNLTDAEVAFVLGHEIGHAMAQHGAEAVSTNVGTQLVTGLLQSTGLVSEGLVQLLQTGARVGLELPQRRRLEVEADNIGLNLMARAGYDPRAGLSVLQKMQSISGGRGGPQFLSTHPADAQRIANLRELLPSVIETYNRSR